MNRLNFIARTKKIVPCLRWMLVLAGLGEIFSTESLKLAASYLADPALADAAGAATVKIAARLPASDKSEIGTVLNQVLKSAKSAEVLDKARKRMSELGLTPE